MNKKQKIIFKKTVSLLLAVILATIFTFFYYNETGRIDIYYTKNPKCSIDITKENNIDYYNPSWCKNCITLNIFDVSLSTQKRTINIKTHKCKQITFEIRGTYKINKNKQTVPIYNTYEDFKINGKEIAPNEKLKKLWHDNAYKYVMNVNNEDTISLEYKIRFIPSGFDWLKIGLLWLVFFTISLGLLFYKKCKKFLIRKTKCKEILERDWLNDIKNFYLNINPVYRHSFWILFIITNIVFSFHTINFLWGNHDWKDMILGKTIDASYYEGRYGAYIISKLLTNNLYLPIISALWSFIALSLSAIFLAIYWEIPKKISYFVIFGLILNITPYTLSWLWYAHWTVNIFFGRLFIVLGLILSNKFKNGTTKQKILYNLLSVILLNFSLAIYPSYIGTLVIVLAGRFIIEMLNWKTFKNGLITTIKQNMFSILNIIYAAILYKIIFEYMKYKSIIITNIYNIQITPWSDMLEKAITCIKYVLQQFTNFSMPFYPDILTKSFLVLSIICMIQILLSHRSILIKFSIFISFFITLFLTKTVAFISSFDSIIEVTRVDFCGYILFNTLIIALCLKLGGILQNIKILISILIIYLFAINDLHQQRTWKFGLETEKMIYNRIQNRIETQEYFDKNINYTIIHLGNIIKTRELYYPNKKHNYNSQDLLTYSLTPKWDPFSTLNFYNHYNIKQSYRINDFSNPEFMSALKRVYDAGLLKNAKVWPAQNSIIVYKDIILIITNKNDLEKAKKLLAKQAKKEKIKNPHTDIQKVIELKQ